MQWGHGLGMRFYQQWGQWTGNETLPTVGPVDWERESTNNGVSGLGTRLYQRWGQWTGNETLPTVGSVDWERDSTSL